MGLKLPIKYGGNNNNNSRRGEMGSFHSGPLSEHSGAGSMHRMSVKSISEVKNVIGAEEIVYQADMCSRILCVLTWILIVLFFPLSVCVIVNVIQEYERG